MIPAAAAPARMRTRFADFFALTKPRLNSLVVFTTGSGYVLGAAPDIAWLTLAYTVVGSALVAGGAAVLNQVAERDIDLAMARTKRRPLPAERIDPREAVAYAAVLVAAGLVLLAFGTTRLAAVLAAATLLAYIGLYTPLKRRTPWAAPVGAIPGALPPVIGWSAATGTIGLAGWSLFGIVFLWQLPHFHALSWLYRDDFRRAGLPLLAVLDANGRRTGLHALVYAAALLPISLLPVVAGLGGRAYAGIALGLGVAFIVLAWGFAMRPSPERARALFLGSLVYLPLLWGVLIASSVS